MILPLLFLLLPIQSPGAPVRENTGIKITVVIDEKSSHPAEATLYLQHDRSRAEYLGKDGKPSSGGGPVIVRCDLRENLFLFTDARKFRALPYPPPAITEAEGRARGLRTTPIFRTERPTLRIEIHYNDTGEEKELFGRRARHIIISTRQISLEDGQTLQREEVEDGWYIDLDIRTSCEQRYAAEARNVRVFYVDQPIENIETVKAGDLASATKIENWFGAEVKTITRQTILFSGAKKELISGSEHHITKVEETALDPALFELPLGFTQAVANWHPDQL